MKPKKSSSLLTVLGVAAGTFVAPGLNAAIDLSDSSTFYSADNWYAYRDNANVLFTSAANSITFSQVNESGYVWAYFSPTTLSVGEKLEFSATFTFGALASKGTFSIGFFNSGLCGESQMITHSYQSGTDVSSMANYVEGKNMISTVTGGMTGVSANSGKAYLRTKSETKTAFLSTASGAQQKTTTFETAFTAPSAGTSYDVNLEILKTASGLDFSVGFNGETPQTVSFETDLAMFDVLGFRSPVEADSGGITISEASVVVIPEPSAFGLLAGMAACALVTISRRRKKV